MDILFARFGSLIFRYFDIDPPRPISLESRYITNAFTSMGKNELDVVIYTSVITPEKVSLLSQIQFCSFDDSFEFLKPI